MVVSEGVGDVVLDAEHIVLHTVVVGEELITERHHRRVAVFRTVENVFTVRTVHNVDVREDGRVASALVVDCGVSGDEAV